MSAVRRERGFALLIVLFVLVLLGFLIARFLGAARSEIAIADNLRGAAIAGAAADGGVELAIARIETGSSISQARVGGIPVSIATRNIAGRINPNTAPPALLAALLRVVGAAPSQAESIADAIVAWRSPAGSPAAQAALDARYRAAGFSAGPTGEGFASRAALAGVIGMTPALLVKITPHLSLFAPVLPAATEADPVVRASLRLAGRIDLPGATVEGPRIVDIQATATGPGPARAVRCALVRLSPSNIETRFLLLRWHDRPCGQ